MTQQADLEAKMRCLLRGTERCYNCSGFGSITVPVSGEYEGGFGHQKPCEDCDATGFRFVLDPDGKFACRGRGFTVSTDLSTWMQATAALNIIVSIRNDGPGWRADLSENVLQGRILATGWSDGFRGGVFSPFDPAPYEPDPLEALVNALGVLLKGEKYDTTG